MTATATLPEPALLRDPAPPGPRFPVGMRVKMDRYFGLSRADAEEPAKHILVAVRLRCSIDDEWVGTEEEGYCQDRLCYPFGWEFEVASYRTGRPWGWVTEGELIEAGYTPTGA